VSYEKLTEHFRRLSQYEELGAIVQWDQAVNMPRAAGARRADALGALARLEHDLTADPRVSDWLTEAQEQRSLSAWERANLREISRLHRRATAVPADLVEETTRTCQLSEQAWRRYRAENDFKSYAPHLTSVVERSREVAAALSSALALEPYDALMDAYEPGMKSTDVDAAFAPLREFLPDFIGFALEKQKARPAVAPKGPFPVEIQRNLATRLMTASGLDMARARLDESHHPFCGGVPRDVRITNRYRTEEFLSGLMGVLHEAGHGKYEQGLPEDFSDQPVGKARGMVMHESQSLLQEMQVSRGRAFMTFLAKEVGEAFPEHVKNQPEAFTVENLYRLQTRVERSLIRVNADEVTYPGHVMVRYDLERDLISARLDVQDLPEAWDAKMRLYLGISTLGNDKDGCLQDVHWPSGAFGYFPLYTLGALVAAQLFATAKARLNSLEEDLSRGDLSRLNDWLRLNVWSQGSSLSVLELLVAATGSPLDPSFFIRHLQDRYGSD
jgi:carboxypeptidase Taq